MKRNELTKCVGCERGVFHSNNLVFYRLEVGRQVANVDAISRQHHLESMIGSPLVAQALGPDEDLSTELDRMFINVCSQCAVKHCLAEIIERGAEK
jgi:hypothetical protein